jgi:hypothetical protein
MRFKKKILGALIASIALLPLIPSDSAYAAGTVEIDNDTNTNGYSNYYSGSWSKLNNGNYGDSRIHWDSADISVKYNWSFTQYVASGWFSVRVYLNNPNFTNTVAIYGKDGFNFALFNQDTARSGYNEIGTVWMTSGQPYTFTVNANAPQSWFNTGADSIQLID